MTSALRTLLFISILNVNNLCLASDSSFTTCLVAFSLPLVASALELQATDQWSYNNVVAQTVLGAVGLLTISFNFISGHYFWRLTEDDIELSLQAHISDIEKNISRSKQQKEYLIRFEYELYSRYLKSESSDQSSETNSGPMIESYTFRESQ